MLTPPSRRSRSPRSGTGIFRCLLVALALIAASEPAVRAAGTVTTNTTAALLAAVRGGGLVQIAVSDVITVEIPIEIGLDTVVEGSSTSGRTAIFSGGSVRRIFRVLPGVRFQIQNCTVREGRATSGGAILNEGFLIASNVVFSTSKAIGDAGVAGADGGSEFGFGDDGENGTSGGEAAGGAVYSTGEATFVDCTFTANSAEAGDGGKGGAGGAGGTHSGSGGDGGNGGTAFGGAVASTGPLAVLRSLFTANNAGGGDAGAGGGVGSTNSTAAGSGSGGKGGWGLGGAIYSAGALVIGQSTFATNLASGGNATAAGSPRVNIGENGRRGGSALGGAIAAWSTGSLVNSTLYTNLLVGGAGGNGGAGTATVGDGGDGGDALGAGVYVHGAFAITNATLAMNIGTNGAAGSSGKSGSGEAGDAGRRGGHAVAADPEGSGVVTVVNSILTSSQLRTTYGPVVDAGANLFSDTGTGTPGPGSILSKDPLLGVYGVATSGTPGLLPLPGSPAVDAAIRTAAPAVDQRGVARPIGVGPDIGALESSTTSYFLSGQILDGVKGVPGVEVRVADRVQTTDASGHFQFGPLASGLYTVSLPDDGAGFVPRVYQLSLEADVADLVFRVVPLTLTFEYATESGESWVRATGRPGREFRLEGSVDLRAWQTLGSVVSDGRGQAEFRHAPGAAPQWFYRVTAF